MCKNDCLISQLKTSTSKIASTFSSLYISFNEWILASIQTQCSIPTSWPISTWNDHVVLLHLLSSNKETITLPVIHIEIFLTPMGLSPGFLSKGTNQEDNRASILFLSTKFAQRSYEDRCYLFQTNLRIRLCANQHPYQMDILLWPFLHQLAEITLNVYLAMNHVIEWVPLYCPWAETMFEHLKEALHFLYY